MSKISLLQYVRGQEFIFSSQLSGFLVVVKWKMIVTKMSNYELRELKHKQGKTLWIMGHFMSYAAVAIMYSAYEIPFYVIRMFLWQ